MASLGGHILGGLAGATYAGPEIKHFSFAILREMLQRSLESLSGEFVFIFNNAFYYVKRRLFGPSL